MDNVSMKQKFNGETYNDSGFAIAFIAHIALVTLWICYAAASGGYAMASGAVTKANVTALLQAVPAQSHPAIDHKASLQLLLLLVLAGVVFSLIWAGIWLFLLQAFPSQVVTAAVLSMPVMCVVLSVVFLATGKLLAGAIFAVIALLAAVWVWFVWDRIDYTSQIVKVASITYSKSSSIFGVAFATVIAQAVWTLVWLLAVFPLCNASWSGSSGGKVLWPLLLLSYFWSCQVVGNILYVSCAGVMARWYFGLQRDEAVGKSTKQALTYSFGSICCGSLIIAVIQTLRALCHQAQAQAAEDGNPAGACLACIAQAILGCIEDIARIFNTFAFGYVAIYGQKFWDAGQQVFELMENSGSDSLVHYSLVDTVSFLGTLAGGLFTCGLLAFLAFRVGLSGGFVLGVAVLGFVTGIAVMSVVSRMMEAGAITLFLCYEEEPQTLAQTDAGLLELFNERKKIA